VSAVWRLEFQERGAPHFHILLFGLPFVPKGLIQKWWGEVIGCDRPFTRIEAVRSWRGVLGYAAKYMAKVAGGLDYVAYLSAVGRLWGVWCRAMLPWAAAVRVVAGLGPWFWMLRRAARRRCRAVRAASRWSGFMLFVSEWSSWLRLAMFSGARLEEVA